jgi:ribose transport system ATP-binding protein
MRARGSQSPRRSTNYLGRVRSSRPTRAATDEIPMSLFVMRGVSKRYGGVRALQDANLVVEAGRIHAVLGENGAGKSTLIKIMAGVVPPDEGEMLLNGQPVSFASPAGANTAGIACIFQELSLIPDLSVADNIAISNPPRRFGLIDRKAQRRIAEEALAHAGADNIHPLALVKDLSLSRRQMVEIAKALARKPRILILDEATSALTAADVSKIYDVLKRLRAEGLALVYISHRMHEIAKLADDCTVFCNGRSVATFTAGTKTDNEVVELMIGREYSAVFPARKPHVTSDAPPLLEVRHLGWADRLNDVSFGLHRGEVIGLGGLDGQGQRELLLALFGVLRGVVGDVLVDGRHVSIGGPSVAKRKDVGMALIPEDRKTEGLMLPMSVRDNLSFAALPSLSCGGFIEASAEREAVQRIVRLLAVRTEGTDVPAGSLSGGNQQKLVIGKWLLVSPRILLLNDPTRGIDVGTKQEMYELLRRLADRGTAILFYSTDYDELIGCCDRVLVMYDGAVARELVGAEITERALVGTALKIGVQPPPLRTDANPAT